MQNMQYYLHVLHIILFGCEQPRPYRRSEIVDDILWQAHGFFTPGIFLFFLKYYFYYLFYLYPFTFTICLLFNYLFLIIYYKILWNYYNFIYFVLKKKIFYHFFPIIILRSRRGCYLSQVQS